MSQHFESESSPSIYASRIGLGLLYAFILFLFLYLLVGNQNITAEPNEHAHGNKVPFIQQCGMELWGKNAGQCANAEGECKCCCSKESCKTECSEKTEAHANATETEAVAETATTAASSLNESGDYVYNVGEIVDLKLANGTVLKVGKNSFESKIVAFIEDKNKPADKTTWFEFDRLYFETGKSVLKEESKQQVANLAAICAAYPAVNLKLGGYTDNTGNAADNQKLSDKRANIVLQNLVDLKVENKRLKAEGYGDQHPLASNDTPEGRAQNRRVAVRVASK